jgi:hypothetical protein
LRAKIVLPGYAVSQRRKRIEEPFGWGKTIGELARGRLQSDRLPKLIAAQA